MTGSKIVFATADTPEREKLLHSALRAVAGANFGSPDPTDDMISLTFDVRASCIEALSNRTLSLFLDPALSWRVVDTAAKGIFKHWDDQMVSDFLPNAGVLQGDDAVNSSQLNTITRYLQVLKHYDGLAPFGEQHAAERAQQVSAILKVTTHVVSNGSQDIRRAMSLDVEGDEGYRTVVYVNDDKLRDLLLGSAYDREAVVGIITQRNIYDADHIISLLDGVATPLTTGSL
jgi:hypothetical protein